ncbi:MAG: hypothetical protein EPO46_04480 [Lysobacter sp.]|nr:MAG: hypothetical protein EPO46_04480 [Lysobacter sp.]
MNVGPTGFDEPLSAEEQALAARLAKLDTGAGPSAALDARILAAARTAASPAGHHARRRRWATAAGVAATLVAVVGLAWQIKPVFEMPPPLRQSVRSTPLPEEGGQEAMSAEVLARATPIPREAAHVPPVLKPVPPPPAPASAARVADASRRVAGGALPQRKSAAAPAPASPGHPHDFLDEAVVGVHAAPPVADATASSPVQQAARGDATDHTSMAPGTQDRIVVSGTRIRSAASPETAEDAASAVPGRRPDADEWIARIRSLRAAGDLASAQAQLRRFVQVYPRSRVPADLRPLLPPRG